MLNVTMIVGDLAAAGVRYVLTGSVAAAAYGMAIEPRDLDVAPDLAPENLVRLADLLHRWGAKPVPDPDWPEGPTPEQCVDWTPTPPTVEHLDHLLLTPHGLVDIVPGRSGSYGELIHRAMPADCGDTTIMVAHPVDLLAHLRMHKAKHQLRQPRLVAIRERLERGETIVLRLPPPT